MTPTARLARLLPPDPRPDGALLAAFVAGRDEAAFAELVRRHGPLVRAACRRLLPDPADADDAFQAAFLLLARRARRLAGAATVGPWLYRVAVWTARNARRKNARRLARTESLPSAVAAPPTSPAAALDLDAALLALPEKYRAALVLCHLQGWSRRAAAEQLGCPEGTLSSLLARGLAKLKARLGGYDPAALAVGATVPAALAAATVSAARVRPSLFALLAGALRVPRATTVGLAAVFALGAGVGLSVREAPAGAQVPTAPAPRERAEPTVAELEDAVREWRARANAAKAVLAAAETGMKLCQEKLRLTEKDGTAADIALDRGTVARFRENVERFRPAAADATRQLRDAEDRLDFTTLRNGADITGTLAVDVTFPAAARGRFAVAAGDLISGRPADGGEDVSLAAWDAARRGAHVRFHYPTPRRSVPVLVEGGDMMMAELVVPLPLTREPGGFVLVRDVGRVVRVGKLPHAACVRFQEALAAAVPVGR